MDPHAIFELPDLWKTIAQNSFDGIMIVDPDQRIVFWNDQATRITGFREEEVLGENCLVGARCPNCLRKCGLFTKGEICERTVTLITKTGREIVVVKNAQLVKDPDGTILGGIEIFHRLRGIRRRSGVNEEEARIREALEASQWSRQKTAETLGISRATLWRKMKRYGI